MPNLIDRAEEGRVADREWITHNFRGIPVKHSLVSEMLSFSENWSNIFW